MVHCRRVGRAGRAAAAGARVRPLARTAATTAALLHTAAGSPSHPAPRPSDAAPRRVGPGGGPPRARAGGAGRPRRPPAPHARQAQGAPPRQDSACRRHPPGRRRRRQRRPPLARPCRRRARVGRRRPAPPPRRAPGRGRRPGRRRRVHGRRGQGKGGEGRQCAPATAARHGRGAWRAAHARPPFTPLLCRSTACTRSPISRSPGSASARSRPRPLGLRFWAPAASAGCSPTRIRSTTRAR